MGKAPSESTRATNVGTSIFFVRKCIKMAHSCNKHLDTYYKVLEFSSLLCILYKSRLRSKKYKNTLMRTKKSMRNISESYEPHMKSFYTIQSQRGQKWEISFMDTQKQQCKMPRGFILFLLSKNAEKETGTQKYDVKGERVPVNLKFRCSWHSNG